ncbi:plasmodesmata-located protein 2-like [Dioscorea cayenensis subsp. rotundata]|uniref:Plasmodesmata-located protein 2-like n=1 Tax=Dioscorea cayennensis subsp. rotundata TaxID=55577 RepID=A0AB40AS62_DIOCR|nr:plasmodesmata-located protein 2-like [Dioscorea cayenensis subsp. rotundata]
MELGHIVSCGVATQQAITNFSSSFIAQSSNSKLHKNSTSSTGQALSDLYQCCGDLSGTDCATCVTRVIPMWSSLFGPRDAAARVQLTSCYALYQAAGYPQVAERDLSARDVGSALRGPAKAEVKSWRCFASGRVYLDKCYISYNYYTDGVPRSRGGRGGIGVTVNSGARRATDGGYSGVNSLELVAVLWNYLCL